MSAARGRKWRDASVLRWNSTRSKLKEKRKGKVGGGEEGEKECSVARVCVCMMCVCVSLCQERHSEVHMPGPQHGGQERVDGDSGGEGTGEEWVGGCG